MQTTTLAGKTVPRIGFGTMRLTGSGVLGPPRDRDKAVHVLQTVADLGIKVIDTAWYYGPDIPNQLLAETLFPYPEDMLIVTKLGAEWNWLNRIVAAHTPKKLREGMLRDLRLLKLDQVPIVHLRWTDDPVVDDGFKTALAAMITMQQEGLLQHIGLSNISLGQLDYALTQTPIATVSNLYNFADRRDDAMVDRTAQLGIAYLPWLPLGVGRTDASEVLRSWAENLGVSTSQVALAWLLQRAPNIIPIPGTSSAAHLRENFAAGELVLPPAAIAAM
jgi:pyridoxine 4-dehydrogenase